MEHNNVEHTPWKPTPLNVEHNRGTQQRGTQPLKRGTQ